MSIPNLRNHTYVSPGWRVPHVSVQEKNLSRQKIRINTDLIRCCIFLDLSHTLKKRKKIKPPIFFLRCCIFLGLSHTLTPRSSVRSIKRFQWRKIPDDVLSRAFWVLSNQSSAQAFYLRWFIAHSGQIYFTNTFAQLQILKYVWVLVRQPAWHVKQPLFVSDD